MLSFSTLSDLLNFGILELKKNKISNYSKEAEWLLLDIIKQNSTWFAVNKQTKPTPCDIKKYTNSIYKRSDHIPLQLIMGKASFYGRDFIVHPDVFIPRCDSEVIIDIIKKKNFKTAIDIGCGTGCIGITVGLEVPNTIIDLIDVSPFAVKNTNINIESLKAHSIRHVFNDDILTTNLDFSYDVIISNPPYIDLKDIDDLEHSVKYYDPLNALSDFKDGLYFYSRIYELSHFMLNDGGVIILEFGRKKQVEGILNIFTEFKYVVHNDISNNPRAIELYK